MKIKEKNAISIIVLVITIIVLSILAATVIISVSGTDVIGEATNTVFKSDMVTYKEAYETYIVARTIRNAAFNREELNLTYKDEGFSDIFKNVPAKYEEGLKVVDGELVYETENERENEILKELGMKPLEKITATGDYLGFYVDVDGNGSPDGVIYKDLLKQETISSAKDYYIINESYDGDFGEKPVLRAKGSGESRFYIMALEDFNSGAKYCWYGAVAVNELSDTDFSEDTSGTSLTVMQNMIAAWKVEKYGEQDAASTPDIWGVIQTKVSKGWFIPSEGEWWQFINAFSLSSSTFGDFGLSSTYLTTTTNGPGVVHVFFWYDDIFTTDSASAANVRLSMIY